MIERIKQEIEQRISDNTFGAKLELIDLLSFIESLEKEQGHKLDKILFPVENIFDMASTLVNLSYEGFSLLDKELKREYGRHIELNRVEESTSKIKGWVARDKSGDLYFFHYDCKPHRTDGIFHSECSEDVFHLDNSMFSGVDWLTEPIKVELTISRVKTE